MLAAAGDLWARFERPELDGDALYWLEYTPSGRGTEILRRRGDGPAELASPAGVDVRSAVHEYGGGAYAVRDGLLVFSAAGDGRLYVSDGDRGAEPLTPVPDPGTEVRYGDLVVAGDHVLAVRERHDGGVTNDLVRVSLRGGAVDVLAAGRDFYSFPCMSSDGRQLAWTTWDHPGMPFLGCELWAADVLPDGRLDDARRIAGGKGEAIFQPQWSPGGRLFYVSDRTGIWNLHTAGQTAPIGPVDAELGWPQWFLGLSSYAFLDDGRVAALLNRDGEQRLAFFDGAERWQEAELPFRHVAWPYLRGDGRRVVYVAAEPGRAPALVLVDSATGGHEVVRSAFDARRAAAPVSLSVPASDGSDVRVSFYEPERPDTATGPPPLLVLAHGGPTDQTVAGLRLEIELYVSRGIAVADVDYGGSTGYGRAYRDRLAGGWGVVDVDDCVRVARTLAADGLVDAHRTAIMGGSAGGYIALCALAFHDTFCAGVSLYGISDLELFDTETHKFESSYTDWLTGSTDSTILRARSPARAGSFAGPLLLLQGTDDRVVTPGHETRMADACRSAGAAVEVVELQGEGHGFRRAESLLRAHEAILDFLGRAFAAASQARRPGA